MKELRRTIMTAVCPVPAIPEAVSSEVSDTGNTPKVVYLWYFYVYTLKISPDGQSLAYVWFSSSEKGVFSTIDTSDTDDIHNKTWLLVSTVQWLLDMQCIRQLTPLPTQQVRAIFLLVFLILSQRSSSDQSNVSSFCVFRHVRAVVPSLSCHHTE